MSPLESELHDALWKLYRQWKEVNYHANFFKRMITDSDRLYKGPVGTLKHLLGKTPTEKSGFERLRRAGKLELTIETLVTQPKWRVLFEDWEIARAEERLRLATKT